MDELEKNLAEGLESLAGKIEDAKLAGMAERLAKDVKSPSAAVTLRDVVRRLGIDTGDKIMADVTFKDLNDHRFDAASFQAFRPKCPPLYPGWDQLVQVDALQEGDILRVTRPTLLISDTGSPTPVGTRLIVCHDKSEPLMMHMVHSTQEEMVKVPCKAWIRPLASVRSCDMIRAAGRLRLNGAIQEGSMNLQYVEFKDWAAEKSVETWRFRI